MPITLRSGKAVGRFSKEVVITFKPVKHLPDGFSGEAPGPELRFNLSPPIEPPAPDGPTQSVRVGHIREVWARTGLTARG